MTFLHLNLLLAGLACVAIPIIIHLLMHRRRKPVMWGAMRFLLEAYRRQRRRLMLEKWLLLACRCLVLALLAMALGRPLIGNLLAPRGGRVLFILIDNSLTSGIRARDGTTALERHKQAAKAALSALREARAGAGESDRAALITLGAPADPVVIPASSDLAAVATLIDELTPTDSRADLPGAVRLVTERLSSAEPGDQAASSRIDPARTYMLVLSEFREGSLDLGSAGGGAGSGAGTNASSPSISGVRLPVGVTVIASEPVGPGVEANVSVAGVEPLRSVVVQDGAGGGASDGDLVRVLLRRSGQNLGPGVTTISTRIASVDQAPAAAGSAALVPVAKTTVRWAAGEESATATASLPRPAGEAMTGRAGGVQSAVVVASIDEDPISGDNLWRRPIEFRQTLRVGVLAPTRFAEQLAADKLDPGSWARLALSPVSESSGIEVVEIEPAAIDSARLAGLDAVVLPRPDLVQDSGWARLGLFLSSGGVVFVAAPPLPPGTPHLWTDGMAKGLGLSSDFSIAREPANVDGQRLNLAINANVTDEGPTTNSAGASLLSLVEGEMEQLLQPITLRRLLALENPGIEERGRALLKVNNSAIALWAGRPGAGAAEDRRNDRGLMVYLGIALDLDWSDLPAKPLMVPLVQEVIRQGVGQARGSFSSIAGGRLPAPTRSVELRPVVDKDAKSTSRAQAGALSPIGVDPSGITQLPVREAGLFAAADERGATLGLVAVNPDARAGRIQPQARDAVGQYLGQLTLGNEEGSNRRTSDSVVWLPSGEAAAVATVAEPGLRQSLAALFGNQESGRPLDWPMLIAALVFAVAEVFLARWASHAEVLPASVRAAAGTLTGGRIGTTAEGEAA